jgi:drug/metabolite transporter (DMT)-like permease
MPRVRGPGAGLGMAGLSAAAFSTSGPFGLSLTAAGWSPGAAATVRAGVAAVLLAVPAVVSLRGRWQQLRRCAGLVTAYGLVAVAGCQVCFFNAIQHLSVGMALVLEYLAPVLVVGWLWARHGQRPGRAMVAGSVLALAGLTLAVGLADGHRADPAGIAWALAAAAGLAVYFVLSARGAGGLPSVALASAGMGVGAIALAILGAAGTLPMHAVFGTVRLAGHPTSWLVPAAGLAAVATGVADVTGIAAARTLGARLASFAALSEVVFAVLGAWLLLGQRPALTQAAGGLLILAGVAAVHSGTTPPPASPPCFAVPRYPRPAACRPHPAGLSRGLPSAHHQEEP